MGLIKIFATGWTILVVAIILNYAASKLGIVTWYPFLEGVNSVSFMKTLKDTPHLSKLFLFILYPLILGVSGFVILKLLK